MIKFLMVIRAFLVPMVAGWRLAAVPISDTVFLILFTLFLTIIVSFIYINMEVLKW